MVFSSLTFLFLFFPAVIALYYLCPKKGRNLLLFLASLLFYAWGEPSYILLMVFSTFFNYLAGIGISAARKREKARLAQFLLILSVVVDIGVLGVFKYADLVVTTLNTIPGVSLKLLSLALPIGISFYTFQALSYTIDVYRGVVPVQKNFVSFGTYIALFPQLIAGPIVQYKTIAEQLDSRTETTDQFVYGIHRFLIGLGKKVLLANQIGLLWDTVAALPTETLPALTAWLGAIAFTFQIYFDFSGYSDMAIGLGQMLGFRFLENFDYPYLSKSGTDFWRRWHISLGTWFREYVYIPLGGNRVALPRQIFNLLIVWGLTGLWHGASWNFMLWGLYWGVILILEKTFLLRVLQKTPAFFQHLYSIFLFIVGWVIFAITDFKKMGLYLSAMFGKNSFADPTSLYLLLTSLLLLLILTAASTKAPARLGNRLMDRMEAHPGLSAGLRSVFYVVIFILCIAFLVGDGYNPFLYFRF